MYPYEIYFSETEGRCRTQIADANKKSQTGLRSGEIVSLKPNDIKRDYLTIERTETSYSLIYPDGTKSDVIYEINQ